MDIGKLIKRARKARGWSQQKLASIVEVSLGTVQNWESGRTEPRWRELVRVCKAFDWPTLGGTARYLGEPEWPMLTGALELALNG